LVAGHIHLSVILILAAFPALAAAEPEGTTLQGFSGTQEPTEISESSNDAVVPYTADFFERYRPITALDMVERVPGFSVDTGGGSRGFGGAAGNILIDGERPSSKTDSAADILSRIPAGNVERIDLIRGQAGGLDLRGQAVAVNVILRADAAAAVRWEVDLEQDIDGGGPTPEGSLSITDRWGATRYTAGLEAGKFFFDSDAHEDLIVGEAVVENRREFDRTKGFEVSGNLNTETDFGETRLRTNGEISFRSENGLERSNRTPCCGEPTRRVLEGDDEDVLRIAVGGDVETPLAESLTGKAITLFTYTDTSTLSTLVTLSEAGLPLGLQRADADTEESESIARIELDWTRFAGHRIEADFEGAFNTLENALTLMVDEGGGLVEVPLPGANSRVEEVRGDFSLSDSWSVGKFILDGGLAVETSTISQTGDAETKRSFFFLKPRASLTFAPSDDRQARLRFIREVAQLDFNDFVSSTNFGDNQFDLGNPDLSPESTWVLEASYEHRFGEIGVLTLTGFHHWIEDVEDLLPVGGIFEVPGNIGDGRRWGVKVESTLPLDRLGIANGRLDIEGRWQDSTVVDPVTGLSRVLSNERDFEFGVDFRQDLEEARIAWGWKVDFESETPFFGIDERVLEDDVVGSPDMDMFIESTRWFGVKMRLLFENVTNRRLRRDRQVFTGERELTSPAFRELRDRRRGRSLSFIVSGTF